MEEIWIQMVDEHNGYAISNLGRVKNLNKEKILKSSLDHLGYLRVNLHGKVWRIHHLVAVYFIRPKLYGECVNHKDGNKQNNELFNIEIVTYAENNKHALENGLKSKEMNGKPTIIIQVDSDGNFVKEYKSLSQSTNYGFNRKMVKRVLNNKDLSNQGFKFYTKEEWLKLENLK